jgi:hypothetical protein
MPRYSPSSEGLTPHGRVGASSTSKVLLEGNDARGEVLLSVRHESALVSLAFGSSAVVGEGPQLSQADGLLRLETKSAISAVTATEGPNEKQKITITGATGGDFTLTFDGEVTDPIPATGGEEFDLAEEIEEALEVLDNIGAGDVAVTGEGPFEVEFKGELATQDVSELVADASGLEGETEEVEEEEVQVPATVTVETTVPGGVSITLCEA